jgi:hypothetical protein
LESGWARRAALGSRPQRLARRAPEGPETRSDPATSPFHLSSRDTPIENIEREGGLIFLQGIENGRAFSFVIVEASGVVSVAVAREDVTVTVFGSCTPLPE